MRKAHAIGIDLGTTKSAVAVVVDGKVQMIANDYGNICTPSCVCFDGNRVLIGELAENRENIQSKNTVFDAKRLIGHKCDEKEVQSEMKHWPFKVIAGTEGKPLVKVMFDGKEKCFSPEEINTMVLKKMKVLAERYIGSPVENAVLSVPHSFNYTQRHAIKEAAALAGLNIIRVVRPSVLAALAYGIGKDKSERNILIFDLGGGTLEVSIVNIDDGIFEERAAAGDANLGGEDFDNRMMDHFIAEFRRHHKKDFSFDPPALARLRTAAEQAKITLSTSSKASIELEDLLHGLDLFTSITREKFEELCDDLFHTAINLVFKALKDAHMEKQQIQDVVLVGGSSCIPKIQQLLRDFFDGKELNTSLVPAEAAASGAAIQAAILSGDQSPTLAEWMLIDSAPFTLGVETADGFVRRFIRRNTTIPTKVSLMFTTNVDKQTSALIQIYEGESFTAKDCLHLGQLKLDGITASPAGEPRIRVTFDIDANGTLTVAAEEELTREKVKISFTGRIAKDLKASTPQTAVVAVPRARERISDDEMEAD